MAGKNFLGIDQSLALSRELTKQRLKDSGVLDNPVASTDPDLAELQRVIKAYRAKKKAATSSPVSHATVKKLIEA